MLINKHDFENGNVRVAGPGTTALGIVGTVLGGAALAGQWGNGTGLFGNGWGLFGGGANNAFRCGDCVATRYDICQSERIGALEAALAKSQSQTYADGVGLGVYDYVARSDKEQIANVTALFNETFKQIGDLKVAEQVNKMEIDKNFQLLNQKVDYENKLTACEIASLRAYVDSTFMPTTKKISLCDICPIPQVAAAVQPTISCVANGHN